MCVFGTCTLEQWEAKKSAVVKPFLRVVAQDILFSHSHPNFECYPRAPHPRRSMATPGHGPMDDNERLFVKLLKDQTYDDGAHIEKPDR
jgi:hypothetical protein